MIKFSFLSGTSLVLSKRSDISGQHHSRDLDSGTENESPRNSLLLHQTRSRRRGGRCEEVQHAARSNAGVYVDDVIRRLGEVR
jgi:hypothetical protein